MADAQTARNARTAKGDTMTLPRISSREEWLDARKELLAKEKEMTRARDALSAERRRLPMVEIAKPYVFEGPGGEASLLDLFEDRSQLIVGHFMFDPSWEEGCSSCSAGADEMASGKLEHLRARDTTLAYVSRAPIAKIEAYKETRAGPFPGTPPTAATSTTTSAPRSTSRLRRSSTTTAPGRNSSRRG